MNDRYRWFVARDSFLETEVIHTIAGIDLENPGFRGPSGSHLVGAMRTDIGRWVAVQCECADDGTTP